MQSLSATVKIQRGLGTEDLVLPIPDAWLETLDWRAGDTLNWRQRSSGGWELTNRTKAERDKQTRKVSHSDAGNMPKQRGSRHDAAD